MKYSDFSTNLKYLKNLNNTLDGFQGGIQGNQLNFNYGMGVDNINPNSVTVKPKTVFTQNNNGFGYGIEPLDINYGIGVNPVDINYGSGVKDAGINIDLQQEINNSRNKGNVGSKIGNIMSGISAGVEPTAELIGSMMDRNYKNPMKYAELDNYANQGNVDSFDALENVYANLDKAPSASKMDFNGINGKGWFDNFLKDTTAGVSLGTSIAPGWGTLIGAVAGAANGLIRSGIQAGKSNKAYNDYLLAQEKANERLMANLNNSYHNAAMNEYNNLLSNMAAFGGKLNRFDMGGDISNGVNIIDSGSTHELNPYEGVQQGVDSQGIPNMVEEGEVIWEDEDYVFSNRLTVPKMPKKKSDNETKEEKFNRLYEGKTFAEVAERLQRESKERPTSSISKDTMNDNLSMLRDLQEEVKMKQQADEFRQEINSMSPEELMGLQQMLGAMGQQGMEQPMPEQIPQEGMMPQGMPDMGMAVNPAMMGQPMMACGGKLKKFGYGGNLFDIGGTMPDLWDKNQLERNELPPKQTYEEQLKYRAGMYEDEMKRLEGDYISAMTLWNKGIWDKFKNGKASNAEKQAVMNVIRQYYHNCITTTSTIDKNVNEALKNNINSLKENLSKVGIDEKDINNIATAVGNEKAFQAYASIGGFENSEAYQGEQGNPNFRTIELEYDLKDLEPGGRIYNLLQTLPSGITVGVGYNSNTSTTGDNPAHYIKLNHDKDGNPLLFEGNQSSYMNAMAEYGDFLTPEQYNEYVKEHPTYYVKDKDGNLELDKNGNPIERKYDKEYHGAKNWSIKDVANRDYYYKFKDKVHNTTVDYRTEKDNGKGGRMRILLPILDGTSIQDIDNYLSNLETHYVNTHHEPLGIQRVGWKKSESDNSYKPILSDNTYYYNTTPISNISVSALPVENLSGLRLEERPIDIPTFDINPFRKERKSVRRNIMNELAGKASDYIRNLPDYKDILTEEDIINAYQTLPDYRNLTTEDIQPTLLDNQVMAEGGELNKYPGGGTLGTVWDTLPDTQIIDWSKVPNLIGTSFLPKTELATLSSNAPKGNEPKERKEHPWWNDQWNNFKTAIANEDWRLHAPEYATALGLAHEYLRDKSKDFAEEADFARHITPPNISYKPTGVKVPYTPESSLALLDRLAGMNAANRNAMINLSNAGRAAKAMYNTMNDMKYFDALGQMERQLREQRNADYLKRAEFNNAKDAQDAAGAYNAAATNAQLENAQLASWSHLMDTLNSEALQRAISIGAMATHLPELISEHAKDEIKNKMLEEMAEKGSLLYYFDPRYQMNYSGNNTTALGGYIDVRPLDKRTKKNRK